MLFFATLSSELHASWQVPLNAEEVGNVTSAAMSQYVSDDSSSPAGIQNQRELRSISSNSIPQHPLGVQVLLVELKEQKASDQAVRLAEVFVFDYQRGVTELNLVDVERNELIDKRYISSVHLPLSEAEITYSKALIWNNAEFKSRVQREIETLQTDSGNVDFTDLQTRVSVLVPNGRMADQSELCGANRCALISLFSADNYSFSIEPVINLMSGDIYLDLVQ